MTDVLDWMINLPTYFLPVAEGLIEFFNKSIFEVISDITSQVGGANWIIELITKILEAVTNWLGVNITVFDALLGTGIVLILSITILKWLLDLIN